MAFDDSRDGCRHFGDPLQELRSHWPLSRDRESDEALVSTGQGEE